MAELRQVDTVWTGLAGSPYFTQLTFEKQAGNATPIAAAVRTWLNSMSAMLAIGLKAQIGAEQTIIDSTTGQPVGLESSAAQLPVDFTGGTDALPPANQFLLRLATSQFNAGRRLQGRVFIPGTREVDSVNGTVDSTRLTALNTSAAGLVTATATIGKWSVYSRTHKAWASVDSATAWSQFAVLRSRRD